jgi:hypothetical protein
LGAAIGPTTGTFAIQLTTPRAFFVYVIALTLAFTLFTVWRLYRRRLGQAAEAREEFLAYPQTSPEIYAWLPYHREPAVRDPAGRDPASRSSTDNLEPHRPPPDHTAAGKPRL